MKNINGEEINKELYEKKINEKLSEIQNLLNSNDDGFSYTEEEKLLHLIGEYGAIHYMYGSFNALNDRGLQ